MPNQDKNLFIEPWIEKEYWKDLDFSKIETPSYLMSENVLIKNLLKLDYIQKETGVKILMALKSFSMFSVFPIIKKYLSGSEASSVHEARLGFEEFKKEVHTFSPSFTEDNIKDYIKYSDHLVFNSFTQWNKFKNKCIGKVSCGLRVNLEHSEVEIPIYDPSNPKSHFGVKRKDFEINNLEGLEGLHFHNLCELNADALERSIQVFEEKFREFIPQMKWINFGGGHHITRKDYDIDLLIKIIKNFKSKYSHLDIYLEPGEAIALNVGVLIASVVDIFNNGTEIAVLDMSPTCHMPDVLEMPYLPTILNMSDIKKEDYNYRLVGSSCLTGDVVGEYSFKEPLQIGQKIVFMNMAIYTMVKNNTFNGINLPNIALMDKKGKIKIIKKFGYKDFKNRLS